MDTEPFVMNACYRYDNDSGHCYFRVTGIVYDRDGRRRCSVEMISASDNFRIRSNGMLGPLVTQISESSRMHVLSTRVYVQDAI